MTSRRLEGTDSQGGDGSKGPKSDLAITARPRERLPGWRGGVARCPRKRSWKAAAFAPGTWDDTGWAGRTHGCDPGPLLPSPPLMGPECPHVCTRPHHHLLRAHPFPPAQKRETPRRQGPQRAGPDRAEREVSGPWSPTLGT